MKRIAFLLLCIASCMANAFAAADLKQWMAGLKDNIYVAQMSLPGAHNAATGHGSFLIFGKCQDKDLAGQWDAGVRVFDLRPTTSGNDCTINHGILSTNLTLRQALTTLSGRLTAYPSEFAVVLMRKEDGKAEEWKTKVAAIVGSFTNVMPFRPGPITSSGRTFLSPTRTLSPACSLFQSSIGTRSALAFSCSKTPFRSSSARYP